MRNRLRRVFLAAAERLTPPPTPVPPRLIEALSVAAEELGRRAKSDDVRRANFLEFVGEMVEATRMGGAGPWSQSQAQMEASNATMALAEAIADGKPAGDIIASEAQLPGAIGAMGDIELALQNIDWRREINFSWLEFTRWGIQQIILISRLYYLKNPIVRRLVDVCAAYIFARGVEVTTSDDAANEVLDDFWAHNQQTFGHVARTRAERAKDLDGNIFWVFFADRTSTGRVKCRTIDPVEIQEIFTDPEDADTEWFFRRCWQETRMDASGVQRVYPGEAWYPALNYEPAERRPDICGTPVLWDAPVYHRKCGGVGKWKFGCPRIYPMLDWAKETRRYLEACAAVAQTLSQFALQIETKGGQQAIQGLKTVTQTSVGPSTFLWDENPPAIPGASWISGPGTTLNAFKTQGAGLDPEKCRQYKLMCCMVKGVPESFLADISTGNLATATSLDRPTETVMIEAQQEWVEDYAAIATYVLGVSARAAGGKLREAIGDRQVQILECRRRFLPNGGWVYEAFSANPAKIEIKVNFPSIREGDMPALVKATVEAMTLDNKGGQIVGIDEKEGVIKLAELIGIDDPAEMAEAMYPTKSGGKGDAKYDAYDPNRMVQDLPAPIQKVADIPGPQPQPGAVQATQADTRPTAKEAVRHGFARLAEAIEGVLSGTDAR